MNGLKTIGIVGGGQLGRMLTLAAKPLGFHVVVINPSPNSPAAQVGATEIIGDLYDKAVLRQLAEQADVITVEIEHLDAGVLETIKANGTPVHPSPATIRLIQDKYLQKVFLQEANIPVADFVEINSITDAKNALKKFGGKMLLKTRQGAYDGRGNALIKDQAGLLKAMKTFAGKALYAESFVPFVKELAIMVARGVDGSVKTYPVVETFHIRNICVEVHAPAQVDAKIQKKAEKLAITVAQKLAGAGVFGIEMFLTKDGKVLINEVAPRVHNSGHYTMDACQTSQFEQHIRAITGLSLGETTLNTPAAVMINILGERDGDTKVSGLTDALRVPHTTVHLYGKSPTKVDRKMGHLTSTGKTVTSARKRATLARKHIGI